MDMGSITSEDDHSSVREYFMELLGNAISNRERARPFDNTDLRRRSTENLLHPRLEKCRIHRIFLCPVSFVGFFWVVEASNSVYPINGAWMVLLFGVGGRVVVREWCEDEESERPNGDAELLR